MGEITEGISRLCDQIRTLRDARYTLMSDLARSAKERRQAMADAKVSFRNAFTEMNRKARAECFSCVSGIKTRVAGLRRGFAGDLDGARRAWMGMNG